MTTIGIPVTRHTSSDVNSTLTFIERLEDMGVGAVWMTTGPGHVGPVINADALTVFAAAAVKTKRILMGTSIVPILPRHPIVVAQQVQVLEELAPGRVRLGVGTGHRRTMSTALNYPFDAPLEHLREYIQILKALFKNGKVDFDGRFYQAHVQYQGAPPSKAPVMASALGPRSFYLCGQVADGAISWLCPWQYLRDVALPKMQTGAAEAGRPTPALLAHVPVLVHDNADEARATVREQIATNPRAEEFANMFHAAGFPEVSEGKWSDGMIDAVIAYGNEDSVLERFKLLVSIGASEIVASPIPVGKDKKASMDRALKLIAHASKALGH